LVLVALAAAIVFFNSRGTLSQWAQAAHDQLNLETGGSLFQRLLDELIVRVAAFRHLNLAAAGLVAYAALEGVEGLGLWRGRRWAEYLTVLATALLIPFEAVEVARKLTLIRLGALAVNVVIVAYLAARKRLFIDI
jgi:uncharacterized membrane protein (DUF2068 family)